MLVPLRLLACRVGVVMTTYLSSCWGTRWVPGPPVHLETVLNGVHVMPAALRDGPQAGFTGWDLEAHSESHSVWVWEVGVRGPCSPLGLDSDL